jgi:hypothetical protein
VGAEQTKVGWLPQVGNRFYRGLGVLSRALGVCSGSLVFASGGGENITLSQLGFLSGPDPRNWNIP